MKPDEAWTHVVENDRLIQWKAFAERQLGGTGCADREYDDIMQECRISAFRSLCSWDSVSRTNGNMSTFVCKATIWAVSLVLQKWRKHWLGREDFVLSRHNMPEKDDGWVCEQSARENICIEALSVLPHRDREVVELRFGIGIDAPLTSLEIGKRFGITRGRVWQIEKRALVKIRHHLENKYTDGTLTQKAACANRSALRCVSPQIWRAVYCLVLFGRLKLRRIQIFGALNLSRSRHRRQRKLSPRSERQAKPDSNFTKIEAALSRVERRQDRRETHLDAIVKRLGVLEQHNGNVGDE